MTRNVTRPVLSQRINRLLRFLPGAALCVPAAVHDARVATRRLREALPVAARGKKGKALLKAVRKITRALGPLRELDVALTTLAEFGSARGVSRDSIARVKAAISEERRPLCDRLPKRLERHDIKTLGQRVTDQATLPLTTAETRALFTKVDERCARRAVRLRAAIEDAAGIYLPDRLHAVRIGVKKLRYAMELSQDLRNARRTLRTTRASGSARAMSARLRLLRQTQDLLGRMNELEVLIARMRALQGTPTVTGLRVSADLDDLVRRLENECRVLHGQYMAAREHLLMVCDHAEASNRKQRRVSSVA
jgi:CHAD domain-containing protein